MDPAPLSFERQLPPNPPVPWERRRDGGDAVGSTDEALTTNGDVPRVAAVDWRKLCPPAEQ